MRLLVLAALAALAAPASAQTLALGTRAPLEPLPAQAGGTVSAAAGPGAVRVGLWHGGASSREATTCAYALGAPCDPLYHHDAHTSAQAAYLFEAPRGRAFVGAVAGVRRHRRATHTDRTDGPLPRTATDWIPSVGATAGLRVPLAGSLHVVGELELAAERRTGTWWTSNPFRLTTGTRWEPAAYLMLGLALRP